MQKWEFVQVTLQWDAEQKTVGISANASTQTRVDWSRRASNDYGRRARVGACRSSWSTEYRGDVDPQPVIKDS